MAMSVASSTFMGAAVAHTCAIASSTGSHCARRNVKVRCTLGEKPAPPAPVSAPFCAGLPGKSAPFGDGFDPLNFLGGKTTAEIKMLRESELVHGRVAMLATLGFVVGETFNPLFGGSITGPAINQFQQVPQPFWELVVLAIGLAEGFRINRGWGSPAEAYFSIPGVLKESYTPGTLGYDPLGLKPTNSKELDEMATKELNNGRLAMIGIAGMVVQELITQTPIFGQ
uniref:Chlorophyll a-b binding protein, chloroplastic n=1 Tax=Mesostigma viride TaxID=41882 RepID=A0A7S5CEE1_MESVI|eukprot:jgi/Mesvir1/18957/Mv18926-RA.3